MYFNYLSHNAQLVKLPVNVAIQLCNKIYLKTFKIEKKNIVLQNYHLPFLSDPFSTATRQITPRYWSYHESNRRAFNGATESPWGLINIFTSLLKLQCRVFKVWCHKCSNLWKLWDLKKDKIFREIMMKNAHLPKSWPFYMTFCLS